MPSPASGTAATGALSLAQARWWARVGVFSALAIVLGYAETFIPLPVPVPGVKLGLANVAVLVALAAMDVRAAALVALLKVLATGLLFGNPLMMAYSAAGTLLAFGMMACLSRIRGLSVVLVAVAGAIAHNVGQLAVAAAILGTWLVWGMLPVLVVAACATGMLCGAAARYTLQCLEGVEGTLGGFGDGTLCSAGTPGALRREKGGRPRNRRPIRPPVPAPRKPDLRFDARVKALALAAYVVAVLHADALPSLALCAAVAVRAMVAAGMRARDVGRALAPLSAMLVFTALFQVLYLQQGAALLIVGPVVITAEALAAAGRMTVALACLLAASIAFMRTTPTGDLAGMLRWMLAPLRAAGARTDGFLFSLNAALAFIPVLLDDFLQLKRAQQARAANFEGGVRQRLAAYTRLFAPLVRSAIRHADTLAEAAVARCLGCGMLSTSLDAPRMAARDWLFLLAALLLAVVAIFL